MRAVADIGAPFGIRYYLEPVAWTPLGSLARAVEVIDAAERDNAGLVLDFWHLWQRGTTPDDVARLDRRFISGVDFADSLGPAGSPSPDQRSRCVWPGEGEIPLREWVAAVRATGFDGWWDNELYSPPHWEWPDPFAVGAGLRAVLGGLLEDPPTGVAILTLRRTRCYGCAIGCRMEGAVRMQASPGRHPGDRARPARASIADTV